MIESERGKELHSVWVVCVCVHVCVRERCPEKDRESKKDRDRDRERGQSGSNRKSLMWENVHGKVSTLLRREAEVGGTREREDRNPRLTLVLSCLLQKQLAHHFSSLGSFSNDLMY